MLSAQVQSNIVPWVLPREDIPFSVRWTDKIDYDKIVVEVQPDMQIKELVNVGRHDLSSTQASIYEVKEALNSPQYFGGVIATKGITKELKEAKDVTIKFYREGLIIHQETLQARIFRPLLELLEFPAKITLKDERATVPLTVRYVGFGDVNLHVLGYIGGRIVTHGKSLVHDLMKRMIKEGIECDETQKNELRTRAYVSADTVREVSQEILRIIKQPADDPELKELVSQMRELFADERLKQTMEEIVYAKVEDMLLSMIIDLYARRPVGNVKLAHGSTTIEALLSAPMELLTLRIEYTDVIGNRYPSSEVQIQIETKIQHGNEVEVQIPIKIENWEHKPFLNVREMKI